MREQDRLARREIREDRVVIERRLRRIRHEDDDEIGPGRRLGRGEHGEPGGGRPRPGRAPGRQADPDVDAAVAQIQRMRMAL